MTNAQFHAEEIAERINDSLQQSNVELFESVRWWTHRISITKDVLHKKILNVYVAEATKRGILN